MSQSEFGESALRSPRETAHRLGVSRRTLERLVAAQKFPRPMKIGARSLYLAEDVERYVESLKAGRGEVPK